MRKMIAAAVTAAALGTLGLTATAAQAQTASHSSGRVAVVATKNANPAVTGTPAVVGIPASITVAYTTSPAGQKCTKPKVTGLPKSVTFATSSTVNKGCTLEFAGVWPKPNKSVKVVVTLTVAGKTVTLTLDIPVLASPCENDATGVGSDTLTPLTDQLSSDYNKTLPARTSCSKTSTTNPYEYSWDAVNPVTGQIGDSIAEKADCSNIPRPDGSSAGITQLATFTKSSSGPYCTNFARSSRPRSSTDPAFAPGGVAFVALAGDAVSWSVPSVNTSAPASLTAAQLNAIYTCTDTNWNQVGGANQAIAPFLPQSGSGTLSFFLAAIGVTTPGPCVSNDNNTLEENEGVNPVLNNPGAIFIYSVGDYIAQTFRSAKCLNTACTANTSGVICKKSPAVLQFWCNVHGTMVPQEINGIAPTTGTGKNTTINPAFPSTFDRTLYDVVPFNTTASPIPSGSSPVGGLDLNGIFGPSGFDCGSTGSADIANYGFVPLPTCGSTN